MKLASPGTVVPPREVSHPLFPAARGSGAARLSTAAVGAGRAFADMVWLVPLVAAANQGARLGVLWRYDNGSQTREWDQVSCAAVLAVNHFNARNGSVVPEFADVPPGFNVQGLYYDAWSTASKAIVAYRKAVAAGADAIVGPSRSAQAVPVSQLAAIDETVTVSPWASSPQLSNPSLHPFFSRTWPADSLTAATIMGAISGFGWRNIGYVGVRDAYADGFKDAMHAWSVENAGKVVLRTGPSFPYGDPVAAREAVGKLKALGTTVNMMVVYDEDIYAVMAAAEEFGMLTDDYIWLVSDTTSEMSTDPAYIPAGGSPELLAGWLRGTLRMTFSPESEKGPGYQRLAVVWSSLTKSDCAFTSGDDSHFVPDQAVFDSDPYDVAACMYDAVAASALALAASADPTVGAQARRRHRPPSHRRIAPTPAHIIQPAARYLVSVSVRPR